MTAILIAVLFFLQILSFYFLVILNTKIAKFQDLEKKQERLMREMDDTISIYLTDMKDENDRLIQELQRVSKLENQPNAVQQAEQIVGQKAEQIVGQKEQQKPLTTEEESAVDGSINQENGPRISMPKNIVASAYARQLQTGAKAVKPAQHSTDVLIKEEAKPLTMEQQVVELAKQGKTPEEIAKQLQKGKTEIELLLKFHN